ncbi:MAG: hypothetical protein MJ106_00700 [Lentisphaeria bacterium]|nr:hypothetical protein [Lentisphaeria bacterium]
MQTFKPMQLVALALCAIIAIVMVGCVGIQTNPDSDLHSNAPAEWEGKSIGVPL